MNYSKIYHDLIYNAPKRNLSGYFEMHHAVPKCMGGSNDKHNLVALTPEEHYVAHQLLVKIFPDEPGLVRAALGMAARKNVSGYVSNKLYGWLKRRNAKQVSLRMKGNKHLLGFSHSEETKAKISAASKGKRKPDSMREKLRAAVSGQGNPMFGVRRSEQLRQAHSERMSGVRNSNADHRIHRFVKGGDEFIGKGFEFRVMYGIEQSCVAHLISGRYKSTNGWKYCGVVAA